MERTIQIRKPNDSYDNWKTKIKIEGVSTTHLGVSNQITYVRTAKDPVHQGIVNWWKTLFSSRGQRYYGRLPKEYEMVITIQTLPIVISKNKTRYSINGQTESANTIHNVLARVLYKSIFTQDAAQLMKSMMDFLATPEEVKYCLENRLLINKNMTTALFETEVGNINIEFFSDDAPNTVKNFTNLISDGFYDGLAFHRVIPGFMAQGGCPNTRDGASGMPGTGGPGYNIKCEINSNKHLKGSLSMAHAGKDTGGSQFFIVYEPQPHLDGVHTVFGKTDDMDVVLKLTNGSKILKATLK